MLSQSLEFSHALTRSVDAPTTGLPVVVVHPQRGGFRRMPTRSQDHWRVGDGMRAGTVDVVSIGGSLPVWHMQHSGPNVTTSRWSRTPVAPTLCLLPVTVGMIRVPRGRAGRCHRAPPLRDTGRSAARRARARLKRGDARFHAPLRRRGDARAILPARLRDGDGVHLAATAML